MKKMLLLVAGLMLLSSQAFGYTYNPTGNWTFITPYWTGTIAGTRVTINPSTSYYTINLNTSSKMNLVQVAPIPTSQPGSPMVSTPAYAGVETATANKWNPKAASTWAMPIGTNMVPFAMIIGNPAGYTTGVPITLTSATHLTGTYHIIMGGTDVSAIGFYGDKTVVPIPAAFWLLASGLVGLIGLRRKQK